MLPSVGDATGREETGASLLSDRCVRDFLFDVLSQTPATGSFVCADATGGAAAMSSAAQQAAKHLLIMATSLSRSADNT
jgi:hypothetical protein